MINISSASNLGIIVPSKNKALAQVLQNATQNELEVLSQGKDLKSVMNTILKQSANSTSSNKELLELVKNNPTLKNLGDVSKTIKDLLSALKSEKDPLPIEKTLKTFLTDIKDLKNNDLKQKLENSGVFLESKLKNVKNPQVELKNTLISLIKNLQQTSSPQNKIIANEAKVLLKSEQLNNNHKVADKLPSTIITNETKTLLKQELLNINPKVLDKLPSLERVMSPQTKLIANEAKILLNSETLKDALPSNIEKDTSTSPKVLEKLSTSVTTLINKLTTSIKKADTIHNPALVKALEKLEHQIEPKILTPENFKLSSIKESLEQVSVHMNKSFTMESKGILASIEKIFLALKNVEQTTTTPKASIEQLLEKNVPNEITKLSESIKSVILKADPLFSKDTILLLNKLETLNTPKQLDVQNNVKEIISQDLKAILLQANDDIAKASHPNQSEILKQIDKLSLQIDNFQLISHLSNGTSLFLPFLWDSLEDGNIEMKKDDDDKFYCDINLKLKEYGDLNLKLTLFEKNQLNLHIYSSNDTFKELVKENIPSLRAGLIDAQITPREIKIFEPKVTSNGSPYPKEEKQIHMGFEVKA